MAHNIDMSTSKPAIAYVGDVPWHGFGKKLPQGASIEVWIKEAQLDWQILRESVRYSFGDELLTMPDRHVLLRSDNGNPLSIVYDDYKIVQPKEVVEFYRDLVEGSGFTLETAGALDEGRKVWALARSNYSAFVNGCDKDKLDGFLLLATSCDKTLATTAAFTSVRVVCQNTLHFAMEEIKGQPPTKCIKVPHNHRFVEREVKIKLGLINTAWDTFIKNVNQLTQASVKEGEPYNFFKGLFVSTDSKKKEQLSDKSVLEIQSMMSCYQNGKGQNLTTSKGTAWGLVNAVTFYVDHDRKSKNQSTRLDSAWFGTGAQLKEKAWNAAIEKYCITES